MNYVCFKEKGDNILDNDLQNQILWFNGIKTKDQYDLFKSVSFPLAFKNINSFVDKINQAFYNKSKIAIVGDYDCDGVCATAIFVKFFRFLGIDVCYIIGDRYSDGYGINKRIIDKVFENKAQILITVDNGINAKEEVAYAKSLGIDVVITDHHEVLESSMPDTLVFNPHLEDLAFSQVSGALVALSLAFSYSKNQKAIKQIPKSLLLELYELASLACIGDVMPLWNVNRAMVKQTITSWRKKQIANFGLRILLEQLDPSYEDIDTTFLAFRVIPIINAPGRLDSASIITELLLSDSLVDANHLVDEAIKINELRKEETRKKELLRVNANDIVNVCFSQEINEGVIGIIAGQIKEQTHKPTFVFTYSKEGLIKGSARSAGSFDVLKNFTLCINDNHLNVLTYGGHKGAMGVTFEKLDDLVRFEAAIKKMKIDRKEFEEEIKYVEMPQMSFMDAYLSISLLEPFGEGFVKPLFHINTTPLNLVIRQDKHSFFDYQSLGKINKMMAFYRKIEPALSNFLFDIEKSVYNGYVSYKGNIKHIF